MVICIGNITVPIGLIMNIKDGAAASQFDVVGTFSSLTGILCFSKVISTKKFGFIDSCK